MVQCDGVPSWVTRELLRVEREALRARMATLDAQIVAIESATPPLVSEREGLISTARAIEPLFTSDDGETIDTLRTRLAALLHPEATHEPPDYARGILSGLERPGQTR